jgi:hypothetical protein
VPAFYTVFARGHSAKTSPKSSSPAIATPQPQAGED